MSVPDEPLLDALDIQGNIVPGFRRQDQLFVGYTLGPGADVRGAVALIAPQLTPLATVLRHRDARKRALVARRMVPLRADLWLNVALGIRALEALGLGAVADLDLAFATGMVPARTGDPWRKTLVDGSPNPAHPANWVVGGPGRPLDLLLTFAADRLIEAAAAPLLEAIEALEGLSRTYVEVGTLLAGDEEHFGFRDGVSQVGVRGVVEDGGGRRPVTTRYGVPPDGATEYGRPGQRMVWPGQFLIGTNTDATTVGAAPEPFRNGSFVVFRRLRQDVAAFRADTERLAGSLATPGLPLTGERLRALVVGRWPSGHALMRHGDRDPAVDDHPVMDPVNALNYFRFGDAVPDVTLDDGEQVIGTSGDPAPLLGLRCPVWAHVRKVNPRDLATDRGDPDQTAAFQMLRRGIPFGPRYDPGQPDAPTNAQERGLLFVAYQRSIEAQFESLNSGWMNRDDAPATLGHDLLVGQRVEKGIGLYGPKSARLHHDAKTPGVAFQSPGQWVIPTGGAYLFAPSISLCRDVAAGLRVPPPRRSPRRAIGDRAPVPELRLSGPTVDDDTVADLRSSLRLGELERLELFETAITDASVPELGALTGLQTLRLTPSLSDVALESLRALRPDLRIEVVETGADPATTR